MLESRRDYSSTLEINAEIESLRAAGMFPLSKDSGTQSRQHQGNRYRDEPATIRQPIDFYVLEDLNHDVRLDAQRLSSFLATEQPNENSARNIHGGEKINNQTQDQCHRKTANRSRAEEKQEQ